MTTVKEYLESLKCWLRTEKFQDSYFFIVGEITARELREIPKDIIYVISPDIPTFDELNKRIIVRRLQIVMFVYDADTEL